MTKKKIKDIQKVTQYPELLESIVFQFTLKEDPDKLIKAFNYIKTDPLLSDFIAYCLKIGICPRFNINDEYKEL